MERLLQIEAALRALRPGFGTTGWPPGSLKLPMLHVAVSGPNRTGKTTTVRALLGLSDRGRPVPPTRVPIEYRWAEHCQMKVYRPGRAKPLTVQLGSADRVDAAIQAIDVDHRRITIELNLTALSELGMVLVDLPPIGMEKRFDVVALEEASAAGAVLHVLHERGPGDADLRYLHTLRVPFISVVNLHDESLQPTRSAVDSYELNVGVAVQRKAVPIVIADAVAEGQERRALMAALGSLRRAQLAGGSPRTLMHMAESVAALRLERARGADGALRSALALAKTGGLASGLGALARLLQLERELTDAHPAADELLRTAHSFLKETAADSKLITDRESARADALCRSYNTRAAARPSSASDHGVSARPRLEFGAFVKPRLALRGALANCIKAAGDLSLTPGEGKLLAELDREVEDGRIEIALLGTFSSGKSALVNALLGVPIDDRDAKLLPTSVKVETATVNRVEYAEKPRINSIEWLDEVTLTLLHHDPSAGTDRLRVHEQELGAIDAWLRAGEVRPDDCEFIQFGGTTREQRRSRDNEKSRALKRTLDACRDEQGFRSYVGPAPGLVARVRVCRFAKVPRGIKAGAPLKSGLETLKDPALALRTRIVHVGYPHELLKHAAFIDTPGTDSHVPHHRATAHSLVSQKSVPVLYCFIATQAAGLEDGRNLEVLTTAGSEALRRVFFVVTRKGSVKTEADRTHIRTRVRSKLREAGMGSKDLFFVELKGPLDSEFASLRERVEAFVVGSQVPQLKTWLERARAVASGAGERAARTRAQLDLDKREREANLKELSRKVARVRELGELVETGDWGRERAKRRVLERVSEREEVLERLIGSLRHKDAFEDLDAALQGEFEALNEEADQAVENAKKLLFGKLSSELGILGLKIAALPGRAPRKDFFDGSAAVEAAREVEWPWTFPVWVWGKNEVCEENRNSVKAPAEGALRKGEQQLSGHLDRWTRALSEVVEAVADGLDAERKVLEPLDPEQEARERERLARAVEASERWVKFFDNLEVEDGASRGKR